jgi:hypothetical protein
MDPIIVPRPKSKWDPNRPVSSLLLAQVQHLNEAERNLPLRYRSGIFHKAIQTEGEAARYVRAVTEAIHRAHDDAAAERARPVVKRKGVIDIAAVADESAERKSRAARQGKKKPSDQRVASKKKSAKKGKGGRKK